MCLRILRFRSMCIFHILLKIKKESNIRIAKEKKDDLLVEVERFVDLNYSYLV